MRLETTTNSFIIMFNLLSTTLNPRVFKTSSYCSAFMVLPFSRSNRASFFGNNAPSSLWNKARFVSKASSSKDIDINPFNTWTFDKPCSEMDLTDVPTLVSSSESVSIDSLEKSDMIIVGVMDDNEEENDDESKKKRKWRNKSVVKRNSK